MGIGSFGYSGSHQSLGFDVGLGFDSGGIYGLMGLVFGF